jgi:hypothetical protein
MELAMPENSPWIDHVVVNVGADIDAARDRYLELGFLLTPRGHHSLGSSNHLAIFDDNYLELLGFEAENTPPRVALLRTARGLSGVAFKTRDADESFGRLRAKGVPLEENTPQAFFRPVELPDGRSRDARFRTFRLDPAATPNRRYFFCQHLDSDLVWRDEWRHHPNGAVSVERIVVEAANPAASIVFLARAFGEAQVSSIPGGKRLQAGYAVIDFLDRVTTAAEFGDALAPRLNDDDREIALTLRSFSIAETRSALARGNIAIIDKSPSTIIVPAREAFGVALEFKA